MSGKLWTESYSHLSPPTALLQPRRLLEMNDIESSGMLSYQYQSSYTDQQYPDE